MVQAAGTDVRNGFRGRVAEWFGRRDAVRESRELERLDRSASELTACQDEVERLRVRQEAACVRGGTGTVIRGHPIQLRSRIPDRPTSR
ncbi:hypothetical protein Sros01_82470 [Streptomyces roseochromogenus]|nr:hypothetical protein Sros01_82470 [Streptomyces roseochromogenus]